VLTSSEAVLFEPRVVRQLLAGQRTGFSNMHRLFALTMIELWRREYRVSAAGSTAESVAPFQPVS